MATTQPIYEDLLRQALNLPAEQKLRLVEEVLQQELDPVSENNRSLLSRLDEMLTRLLARLRAGILLREDRNGLPHSSPARQVDPRPAMGWLRLHSQEYGGQWVALDGDRLIAHGPDAKTVYAAAKADGAYLPLIKYVEPADALPFIF